MDTPVLPKPEYLTLPEVVASLCPPLSEVGVRRAIEEALCDGRLVEEPRPIMSRKRGFHCSCPPALSGSACRRIYRWHDGSGSSIANILAVTVP